MKCPDPHDLPTPPEDRTGWPWTEGSRRVEGDDLPLISIVIPSYNQEHFVEETLRSVLLQGYPRLEILLCDDSTDRTPLRVQPYRKWIEVVASPNRRTQGGAINDGFDRAQGDIVTWISTDDLYLPNTFARVADTWLNRPEVGAIIGGFRFIDAQSRSTSDDHPARLEADTPVDLTVLDLDRWRLHQVATFYSAKGLEAAGRRVRDELEYVMDRELLFRVVGSSPVAIVPETLGMFRLHDDSKSASTSKTLAFAREFASLQDQFMDNDSDANRRRQRIKQRRIAKGYLRNGKYNPSRSERLLSLLQAPLHDARFLLRRSYWVAWLDTVGVGDLFRSAMGGAGT